MKTLRVITAVLILFLGIAGDGTAQTMTNSYGWDEARIDFPSSGVGTAETREYYGAVGDWVEIWSPTSKCSAGGWTYRINIVSGSLPPGVEIVYEDDDPYYYYGDVVGEATASGRWVVTLEEDDVWCGGKSFWGFRQTLIFNVRP